MSAADWLALVGILLAGWAALASWMVRIGKALERIEMIAEEIRGLEGRVERNADLIRENRERIVKLEGRVA